MSVNSFENYPLSWRPVLDKSHTEASLSTALADLLEQDIVNGKLLPGTKLPPQRELADFLEIGLSTVTRAFKLCRQRGLLCSAVGSGTFVASDATENSMLLANPDEHSLIDLGSSTSALHLNELLSDSFKRLISDPDFGKLMRYDIPGGSWISRQAGMKWMELSGFKTTSERIMVASGAQNALAGCILGLFAPGDRLAVHSVSYQGIRNIARLFRLQLVPFPEDPDVFTTKGLIAFFQRDQVVILSGAEADHQHILRQVDVTSGGVLLVYGSDHAALAQEKLVLGMDGPGIGRIVKGQGTEIHPVSQGSLHELTVEEGQQGVTDGNGIPHEFP